MASPYPEFVVTGATPGVDAYSAIMAAVASAKAAGGGSILLPRIGGAGYTISDTIVVDFDNCTILLDDDVTLTKTSWTSYVGPEAAYMTPAIGVSVCAFLFTGRILTPGPKAYIKNPQLIGLRRVKVNGNGLAAFNAGYRYTLNASGQHHSVLFSGCYNACAKNIWTDNGLVGGLTFLYCLGATALDCDASNSVYDNGIYAINNGEHLGAVSDTNPATWANTRIINCRAWDCYGVGLGSIGAVGCHVINGKVWNCGNNGDKPAGLTSPVAGAGIGCEQGLDYPERDTHGLVIGAEVYDSYSKGIFVVGKGVKVVGSRVRNIKATPARSGSLTAGVYCVSYADADIECDISGSEQHGLLVLGGTDSNGAGVYPSVRYKGCIEGSADAAVRASGIGLLDIDSASIFRNNGSSANTATGTHQTVFIDNRVMNTGGGELHLAGSFRQNLAGCLLVNGVGVIRLDNIDAENNQLAWSSPSHQFVITGTIQSLKLGVINSLKGAATDAKQARVLYVDPGAVIQNVVGNAGSVLGDMSSVQPTVSYGAGAAVTGYYVDRIVALGAVPTSVPTFYGQQVIDTSGGKVYVAKGKSGIADWVALN